MGAVAVETPLAFVLASVLASVVATESALALVPTTELTSELTGMLEVEVENLKAVSKTTVLVLFPRDVPGLQASLATQPTTRESRESSAQASRPATSHRGVPRRGDPPVEATVEFEVRYSGSVGKCLMDAASLWLHVRAYNDHLSCKIHFQRNGTSESCKRQQ